MSMDEGATGISLGAGLTLVEEEALFAQFAPFGYTKQGFRKYCRAIGVPYLHNPDGTRLYWLQCFQMCIAATLGVGQKPFLAPGSIVIRQGFAYQKNMRRSMTQQDFERRWKDAAGELLLARRSDSSSGTLTGTETRQRMSRHAEAIITALANQSVKTKLKMRARARKAYDATVHSDGEEGEHREAQEEAA